MWNHQQQRQTCQSWRSVAAPSAALISRSFLARESSWVMWLQGWFFLISLHKKTTHRWIVPPCLLWKMSRLYPVRNLPLVTFMRIYFKEENLLHWTSFLNPWFPSSPTTTRWENYNRLVWVFFSWPIFSTPQVSLEDWYFNDASAGMKKQQTLVYSREWVEKYGTFRFFRLVLMVRLDALPPSNFYVNFRLQKDLQNNTKSGWPCPSLCSVCLLPLRGALLLGLLSLKV